MKQVYIDSYSKLFYLRADGLLFVQLSERCRDMLATIHVGTACIFEREHSVVSGVVCAVTKTGVALDQWEVQRCQ